MSRSPVAVSTAPVPKNSRLSTTEWLKTWNSAAVSPSAAAAALALTAALFHVLNHGIFKSLLFFGSGAVLTATGERDMEHLGGLIHRMPVTALTFLIGSAAISALPPLNGFASEWLTFQAILVSPQLPQRGLKLTVPAVGALLALSAALAAACFVKAFGVTFLGRPRTPAARQSPTNANIAARLKASVSVAVAAASLRGLPWNVTPNALTKQAAANAAESASSAPTAGTISFSAQGSSCGLSRIA